MPKNGGGGLGQFADLRRRLGKKERGGVFKGGVPIGKIKSSLFHCFHFLKKSPNNKNESHAQVTDNPYVKCVQACTPSPYVLHMRVF